MTKVDSGKFYEMKPDGTIAEVAPTAPDVWVCRRVADCLRGKPPPGAATARCTRCGEPIAFNPARNVTAPKSCMQCSGMTPNPPEPE